MKDFPFFTTQNGAAALTLQEIPYNRNAYITIHDTRDLDALLQECADFCKAVGAENIYACNHSELFRYPVYTRILKMVRPLVDMPVSDAYPVSVTDETLLQFTEMYNDKMKNVPAAKYLTGQRAQMLLQQGSCYFVYRENTLIGIGVAADGEISSVASVQAGAGADVVSALCSKMTVDQVCLEVAQENKKARQLYERLGFQTVGTENIWYKIY